MVSYMRLYRRKSLPRARASWMQDSGGFNELRHGFYRTKPRNYAERTRLHSEEIGKLEWAAIQDWMCEEVMLERTGLTVMQHQQKTVESYLDLREIDPALPWLPVLQGWEPEDYLRHVDMYLRAGVDLLKAPLVGVGSVCKRQHTMGAVRLLRGLRQIGLHLHGFGLKITSTLRLRKMLDSTDSMAWSYDGRMPKGGRCSPKRDHNKCGNCLTYALKWYWRLMTRIEQSPMLPGFA